MEEAHNIWGQQSFMNAGDKTTDIKNNEQH
jgi:hypothetical protein